MPGLERHAAVPGAEVRRAAGRALPDRSTSPRSSASVDYCSGCGICSHVLPAGGEDRRDQRPGAQQAQAPEGRPAARPDHHPADRGSAARARRWRRWPTSRCELPAAPRSLGERVLGIHRDAPVPKFAGRRFSRWARSGHRARPTGRKIVYFHGCGTEYYEPWEGEKVVAVLEHNGFEVRSPSRTAAGCRCSRAACSTTRARSCCGSAARSRRTCADDGHAHRRQRHELHADAQARGPRDPRARGRPGSEAASPSGPTTSASCCSSCTTAASSRPTSRRSTSTSPTTRPASSRATGSASRRSSCSR